MEMKDHVVPTLNAMVMKTLNETTTENIELTKGCVEMKVIPMKIFLWISLSFTLNNCFTFVIKMFIHALIVT